MFWTVSHPQEDVCVHVRAGTYIVNSGIGDPWWQKKAPHHGLYFHGCEHVCRHIGWSFQVTSRGRTPSLKAGRHRKMLRYSTLVAFFQRGGMSSRSW